MGQKVSPTSFRTGITKDWKSRWYAPKASYGQFLIEDHKIRAYLDANLNRRMPYAAISSVQIERTREEVKVIIYTARPGVVIGARGAEIDRVKGELEDLTHRVVSINVVEVRKPDIDAQLTRQHGRVSDLGMGIQGQMSRIQGEVSFDECPHLPVPGAPQRPQSVPE